MRLHISFAGSIIFFNIISYTEHKICDFLYNINLKNFSF
jgi:hypothetical protein